MKKSELDPKIAVFDKKAELYQQKFMDQSRYAEGLNRCCELLGTNQGKLLDLGCGPGNVSRYLLDKIPWLRVEAVDLSPAMVALAQNNLPTAMCSVGDVRELDIWAGGFDIIVAGFCIPYLNREAVRELVLAAYQKLNLGGLLYLSFMEGDYSRSGYQLSSDGQDKAYIHYYPAEEIRSLFEASGFEIDSLLRTNFEKEDGSLDVDVQIIGVKQLKN